MKQAKNKFLIYAMLAVFVFLFVILSVINIISFTMAASDADEMTKAIMNAQGVLEQDGEELNGVIDQDARPGRIRPGMMGPDNPDMNSSIRYFAVKINKEGEPKLVSHRISAFTEEDAEQLALKLKDSAQTGWTNVTYRYRVYSKGKSTYVIVADYGRELLSSYRILNISLVGGVAGLIISFLVLMLAANRVFQPLLEADRKQKNFIKEAESELKIPLTVIDADAEVIEKEHGSDDYTKSIHRQVKKMSELVDKLGTFGIFSGDEKKSSCDISEMLEEKLEKSVEEYKKANIKLVKSVEKGATVEIAPSDMEKILDELIENSRKFALSYASYTLERGAGRTVLKIKNDADIEDGQQDQIFDRFIRLKNAEGKPGDGLGLSYVKEVVSANNGRLNAASVNKELTVTVTF